MDLQRALDIAIEAHRGQQQKNGLPYILHPLSLMQQFSANDAKIVALLHDVVEDSNWDFKDLTDEGFATAIIAALDCLTHREGENYTDYIARIASNDLAREVKLADLSDNMDIRRLPSLDASDLARLEQYHKAWHSLNHKVGS